MNLQRRGRARPTLQSLETIAHLELVAYRLGQPFPKSLIPTNVGPRIRWIYPVLIELFCYTCSVTYAVLECLITQGQGNVNK